MHYFLKSFIKEAFENPLDKIERRISKIINKTIRNTSMALGGTALGLILLNHYLRKQKIKGVKNV